MFHRSVRALCVVNGVNTAAFKQFRAELADPTEPVAATKARFALDADRIAALQLRAQAQEQQLAEVAAEAFKPSVDTAAHAVLIADLEAYRAQLTDHGGGTYVASLVKALESPDDGEAVRKTVWRGITVWAPSADHRGLDLVFKAADALQPQFKVLSAEVKAALVEIEAAIPTATANVARKLLQIDFALRTDEASVAFEGLERCANGLAWDGDAANRHGLEAVLKAAGALQQQFKVLSAEVKAALVEVEAAIPTATANVARNLVQMDFALRSDERALAHRYTQSLQKAHFTPEEQAQYAPLVKAIEAAIMEKCFAESLSASVDHPDVFDLSKVFFDEPVAGSPCVLCVFSDQPGGPLLPLRAHRTKLRDATRSSS